jgi:hypothetical protein
MKLMKVKSIVAVSALALTMVLGFGGLAKSDPSLRFTEAWPLGQFVAASARMNYQQAGRSNAMTMKHNFKTGEQKFERIEIDSAFNRSLQVRAPVILSFDKHGIQSGTLWNFDVLLSPEKQGLWNQKTNLGSVTEILRHKDWTWSQADDRSLTLSYSHKDFQGEVSFTIEFERSK